MCDFVSILVYEDGDVVILSELYQLAEDNQIEVDYYPMHQAVSLSFPEGWIAIDVDKLRDTAEEKACLAHELGHCLTGSFYNIYSSCDIRSKREARAQKWAIRHLIPPQALEEAVAAGFTQPWELAEYFGVPESFVREAEEWYASRPFLPFPPAGKEKPHNPKEKQR